MNLSELEKYREKKDFLMRNGDKEAPRNAMMQNNLDGNEGVDYPSHGAELE